jgi:hypothetical protein
MVLLYVPSIWTLLLRTRHLILAEDLKLVNCHMGISVALYMAYS